MDNINQSLENKLVDDSEEDEKRIEIINDRKDSFEILMRNQSKI